MRRTVLIALAGTAMAAAGPAAGAIVLPGPAPVTVQVTPKAGGPRTTFRLSLRNPFTTGPAATLQRSETVDVSGPRRSGCVGSGAMAVPATPAQQLVRLALTPSRLAGAGAARRWCAGTFQGSIIMAERFLCTPPRLCPMIEIRPQTVARFSFRVTRRS
ncbi:MAG: hypothetical protein ACXVRM_08210 [Solirubrobacteraceae bacterium]